MAKIGNLYNLGKFQKFSDSYKEFADNANLLAMLNAASFGDSGGLVMARNLEAVDPRIYEKKFPDLSFVNSGIEVNNTGGYAKTITSLRTQVLGSFRTGSATAANGGKISLSAEKSQIDVIKRKAESSWDISEVRESALQGINIVQNYLAGHNEVYLREVDEIGYLGLDANEGLLNWSGFVTTPAVGAIGGLTPVQMYNEFRDLIETQRSAVANTPAYSANRVVMPTNVFNVIQKTILDTAGSTKSVLLALRENFPEMDFMHTFRAPTGASATVAFNSGSEAMQMRIPTPLEIGEIIKPRSFDFLVDSIYRIAGLDVVDNTSGYILTGL